MGAWPRSSSACACALGRARDVCLALALDAVLHDPPPAPVAGKCGPKPKKGSRQASLKARLTDPQAEWQTVTLRWYGGEARVMELTSGTALWYTPGETPLALRWVLVRDPSGKQPP